MCVMTDHGVRAIPYIPVAYTKQSYCVAKTGTVLRNVPRGLESTFGVRYRINVTPSVKYVRWVNERSGELQRVGK